MSDLNGTPIKPVAMQTWAEREAKRRELEGSPNLTMRQQGQLAALCSHPCSPPPNMADADEDEWCEGWSDYGDED